MSDAVWEASKEAASGGLGTVIGLPLLYYFYKRVFTKVAVEDTSKAATVAESGVIDMLRLEVERMSKINGELSVALSAMQIENIKMQQENFQFRQEISDLHQKIKELTGRLNAIHGV
jgi:FtsZ-binding cell division protein ZapB